MKLIFPTYVAHPHFCGMWRASYFDKNGVWVESGRLTDMATAKEDARKSRRKMKRKKK